MRIGIRKAHTKNCYGATGYLDEWVESRNIVPKVIELLTPYHTIIDCTPNESLGWGEWNTGVRTANNSNLNLFFSIHFNSSSGDPQGTEACVYNTTGTAANYAKKIVDNIASLGFKNRGLKKRTDLAETSSIKCPSFVLEVCFVQETDGKLYKQLGVEKIARAIANAIEPRVSLSPTQNTSQNTPQAPITSSNLYRVRLSWEDSKSQKGAYGNLNNAINECKKYSGYKVFNNNGKQVYPEAINTETTKLIKSYSEKGKATVTGASVVNVRNSYKMEENNIAAKYNNGEFFYYDTVYITEYKDIQYVWCSYVSVSGVRRYVCAKEGNTRYLTCV